MRMAKESGNDGFGRGIVVFEGGMDDRWCFVVSQLVMEMLEALNDTYMCLAKLLSA